MAFKVQKLIQIALAGFFFLAIEASAQPAAGPTQVVILGTIHGHHLKNIYYSPEALRTILLELKPDAILNELPLNQVDADGRPLDKDRTSCPENWASDGVATQLGIKQIPFDRPNREEHYNETRYFQRQRQAMEYLDKWNSEQAKAEPVSANLNFYDMFLKASQAQRNTFEIGTPEIINSKSFDFMIRLKHGVLYELLPALWADIPDAKEARENWLFLGRDWQERNRVMSDNILKAAAKYPGKLLVVLTGCEHRYLLREMLSTEKAIELKEYWELVDVKPERAVALSPVAERPVWGQPLSEKAVAEYSGVAREYWEAVIKGDWALVSEFRPIQTSEKWASQYGQNPPVELLAVGQPRWEEGCTSSPVVPTTVKYADGKIREILLITDVRHEDGVRKGRIPGTLGTARELANP